MKKKLKSRQTRLRPIPKFKNEDEERSFWATADTSEYFDFSKARTVVFPNLKPTQKPISLRISKSLLTKIKLVANKKDVPYQSLMKLYLDKAINRDYRKLAFG